MLTNQQIRHEELFPGLRVHLLGDDSREVFTVKHVTKTSAIVVDSGGGMLSALASELRVAVKPPLQAPHSSDTDYSGHVDGDASTCTVCGVLHGDPCPQCGGRGYHADDCED